MLNQVVVVGRLVKDPELRKSEKDKNYTNITLAVPRSYKNVDGTYDTDFINCVAFDNIAANTCEYCNKGDIIGVKGRLQSRVVEDGDNKEYLMDVICEKVTFLSSKPKDEEEVEE